MKGTQRNRRAGKRHWDHVYRYHITMKRINAIMMEHWMPRIVEMVYEKRPLMVLMPRTHGRSALKRFVEQ